MLLHYCLLTLFYHRDMGMIGVVRKTANQVSIADPFERDTVDVLKERQGILRLKKKYGQGQVCLIPVKQGVAYCLYDLVYHRDTRINPEKWKPSGKIWFNVCLSGSARYTYREKSGHLSDGCSDVFVDGYDKWLKKEIKKDIPQRIVSIVFDPDTLTAVTGKTREEIFRYSTRPTRIRQIPWAMKMAAEQLAAPDFSAVDKPLFTEAKVLELTAYLLGQYDTCCAENNGIKAPGKQDLEKIRYAAELMNRQMIDPPGIFDLADQAGLNHNKLIRGFKEVFEMTPFEYLSKIRLQKAAGLIAGRHCTVTEAAVSVGYSNLSHFAKIFRREYGMPPSKFSPTRCQ